jgi:DNA-binding transcriptional regulator YdaS (Cro superfamily)
MKQARNPILNKVFQHYGSASALARELGLGRAAVSAWRELPMKHLRKISNETGISRRSLRPDLYEDD